MRLKLRAAWRLKQVEKARNVTTAAPGGLHAGLLARPRGRSLPAPIHRKFATTAVVRPDPGAVPAPAVIQRAAAVGLLLHESYAAIRTDIDLAKGIALAVAVAAHPYLAIPARTRSPAIIAVTAIVVAMAVKVIIAVMRAITATGLGELSATTVIHPQTLAIHAPAQAAGACAFRFLPDQLGIAPWHRATIELSALALATNRSPGLRLGGRRGSQQKCAKQTCQRARQNLVRIHTHERLSLELPPCHRGRLKPYPKLPLPRSSVGVSSQPAFSRCRRPWPAPRAPARQQSPQASFRCRRQVWPGCQCRHRPGCASCRLPS